MEPVYGFTQKDHQRVSRVVRTFETSPIGSIGKGNSPTVQESVRRGVTTSVITARSELSGIITPGSGYASFWDYNARTNTISLNEEQYLIRNDWTDDVSDNTEAIFHWRGAWWVDGWEC